MIQNHFDDDANAAVVRPRFEECFEILERSVARMHGGVVRDIVTVVAQRRWEKREEPDCSNPNILQIVEPLRETREVADAISVAIAKCA